MMSAKNFIFLELEEIYYWTLHCDSEPKKYQTADFLDKIILSFVVKCNFQLWHMIGTVFELMTELSLFASLLKMMMSYLFWFWLQQRRTCSN